MAYVCMIVYSLCSIINSSLIILGHQVILQFSPVFDKIIDFFGLSAVFVFSLELKRILFIRKIDQMLPEQISWTTFYLSFD